MNERAGVAVVALFAGLVEGEASPAAVVADGRRDAFGRDGHAARIARGGVSWFQTGEA